MDDWTHRLVAFSFALLLLVAAAGLAVCVIKGVLLA